MKLLPALVGSVALAGLLGCGRSDQTAPPAQTSTNAASATATATNQQDSVGQALEKYGKTMATAKKTSQIKIDLISVNQAIQAYEADRGKHPESLDELIKEGFLPKLPDLPSGKKYSYNPQTGEVKVVDGP